MGTVIGPITAEDWVFMKNLRGNMKHYQREPERFDLAIKKTREMYRNTLKVYTNEEAA
jgi:hypothetical protein